MQQRRPPTPRTQKITTTHKQTHKQTANLNLADDYDDKVVAPPRRQLQQYETIALNNSQKQKHKDWVHGNAKYICKNIMNITVQYRTFCVTYVTREENCGVCVAGTLL